MNKANNQNKFLELRTKYPSFTFENYTLTKSDTLICLRFEFNLNDCHFFSPVLEFSIKDSFLLKNTDLDNLDNVAFHIGMIELLSYWKASCSPNIIIKPFSLSEDQTIWWKKLYYKGLGEFFYLNSIQTDFDSFVNISSKSNKSIKPGTIGLDDELILPIGGGKDSIVSLECLKAQFPNLKPLVLNLNPSRSETIKAAGISKDNTILINRVIHPQLLVLNNEGFLNGHTPFSALLAFVSVFCALVYKQKNIALSNESSANEATDLISGANHQYSKSYEFEEDFRDYTRQNIHKDLNYFSFLRPLNELQISKLFCNHTHHFSSFLSCNIGSKKNIWCESCPKCLFTFIILIPFIKKSEMNQIFESDLLSKIELKSIFDELIGIAEVKPFECVGTYDDVNFALQLSLKKYQNQVLPELLEYYKTTAVYQNYLNADPNSYLTELNKSHFLNSCLLKLLKEEIAC